MGYSITQKILSKHLVEGTIKEKNTIGIRLDQILFPDSSGTMVCLEFEALNIPKVQVKTVVSYIDHNTLQVSFENADDHLFMKTFSKKYGVIFSRPGNGICHQLHVQRFAKPGETLLGADSHTPTSGALGMVAIGGGGLDIASVMGGLPYYLKMPQITNIILEEQLQKGVSAKDIILYILSNIGVKGGLGKIFEYTGSGVDTLSIEDRTVIANMGTELGLTSSVFPSDHKTYEFLKAQDREQHWTEIYPDKDANYSETITINLSEVEPLVAQPHSPDNVVKVRELENIKLDQVFIGSCTNSSYLDLAKAAHILNGKKIHPNVSLVISPGTNQVFQMALRDGLIEKLVSAGARILECACGPCVGVGQAPPSKGVSLRTTNRNFMGRSGTSDANIYLASTETAAVSALNGTISDPRLSNIKDFNIDPKYIIDDSMFVYPEEEDNNEVEVRKGPNIKEVPIRKELDEELTGEIVLKLGDNITTDDIMPAGAQLLSLRSNIPEISKYVFSKIDSTFIRRIKKIKNSFIVAGENYGQGSSREHAALAPMYLGLKVVIAKSFARIHFNNLLNFGIIPLIFKDKNDYKRIDQGDILAIKNIRNIIQNEKTIIINIQNKGIKVETIIDLSPRLRSILLAGGLLNYVKQNK
jgi:aconitate hydratase